MSERISRTFPADLEVRSDGRTVCGIAVPFDTPTDLGGVTEVFRFGAFTRTISERGDRVKLLVQHDRAAAPLGRVNLLREDTAGLYVEARVSNTAAGHDALELIRDGALDAFSIGFKPITDRWSPDRSYVERVEAALYEISAVGFPAYESALITAVRSDPASLGLSGPEARRRLTALQTSRPHPCSRLAASEAAARFVSLARGPDVPARHPRRLHPDVP